MEHTPGPWLIVNDEIVVKIHSGNLKYEALSTIARIRGGPRQDADARLIAAAPEMYEIVKIIIKEWEECTTDVHRGVLVARLSQYAPEARAILKKVEGDLTRRLVK